MSLQEDDGETLSAAFEKEDERPIEVNTFFKITSKS